ncbi:MAG: hypothetical protein IKH05_04015 [Bacteroidaceae bacterium]|nr:hypothetical protein [Bacteroidaceae bacterium]
MMRKLLSQSILLLITLVSYAQQVKVSPTLEKGMRKTYVTESVTEIQGQKPITLQTETQYEVTDVTPDGYTVTITVTKADFNHDINSIVSRVLTLSTEMMKGVTSSCATDKDGQIIKLLNYEDIRSASEKMLDDLLKEVPLPQGMSADALKPQILKNITEESLLKTTQMNTGIMGLNGKTITSGMEEEYTLDQGIKMKRTYKVNPDGSILATGVLGMTMDELKNMVISQLEKANPAQAEAIKGQIDAVIANLKLEVTENSTYTFAPDGWVDTLQSEVSTQGMGAKTVVRSTIRLSK